LHDKPQATEVTVKADLFAPFAKFSPQGNVQEALQTLVPATVPIPLLQVEPVHVLAAQPLSHNF
jgi:hypothetical protein